MVQRIGQTIVVMWLVATLTFLVFRVIPGDPTTAILGLDSSPEARSELRRMMGLDQPVMQQYLDWLFRLIQGDLGTAYTQGNANVASILAGPLLRSFELAILSTLLAVAISIPLALIASVRAGKAADAAIRGLSVASFSLPSFWFGILLLLLFARVLHLLPAGGYIDPAESPVGYVRSLVLPAITVATGLTGIFVRFLRSSLIDNLRQDYILTVRAKGVTERVVLYRHALRNSLIPFVTIVGIQFGLLVGGLVVVEQVFSWPGIGRLMVQAVLTRAFDLIQGAVLLTAMICVVVNLSIDILYRLLDPRISYG